MTILIALLLAAANTTTPTGAPIVWPAKDVIWTDAAAVKGAKLSVLWGDPKKEASGTFKKFPAGTEIPPHTHSSDLRTIVVAGTLSFRVGEAPAQELGPGSYAFVPSGVVHGTTCGAESECVVYEEQPGPADFLPQKGEAKR